MSEKSFDLWRQRGESLPKDLEERRSWRQGGFQLNPAGDPLLSDGQLPKHGLEPIQRY